MMMIEPWSRGRSGLNQQLEWLRSRIGDDHRVHRVGSIAAWMFGRRGADLLRRKKTGRVSTEPADVTMKGRATTTRRSRFLIRRPVSTSRACQATRKRATTTRRRRLMPRTAFMPEKCAIATTTATTIPTETAWTKRRCWLHVPAGRQLQSAGDRRGWTCTFGGDPTPAAACTKRHATTTRRPPRMMTASCRGGLRLRRSVFVRFGQRRHR